MPRVSGASRPPLRGPYQFIVNVHAPGKLIAEAVVRSFKRLLIDSKFYNLKLSAHWWFPAPK